MQKRVNTAGLRLPSLERSAYNNNNKKKGLLTRLTLGLIPGNLAFNHSLTDKTGFLYLDCTNYVIHGEHVLSFRVSEKFGVVRQSVPI